MYDKTGGFYFVGKMKIIRMIYKVWNVSCNGITNNSGIQFVVIYRTK